MMTNDEKYPKTEDALAAFRKHKEECECDCAFDKWLKMPCDDDIEKAIKDIPKGFGVSLAGILAGTLVASAFEKRLADTPKTVADENAGIECPFCHKKNGSITRPFICWAFKCPDCGANVGNDSPEIATSENAFRKWFSQFSNEGKR